MARDDFDRRRLRSLYERNRSRVSALADARDRRRGGDDSYAAPRRYVVSERRTRVEGFGRGGAQVRRVERKAVRGGGNNASDQPRARRFSDRGIFRRGGRDRFRRAEDDDREDRRDRFREQRDRRDGAGRRDGAVRRFGEARRGARLRLRSRRRAGGNGDARRVEEERRQRTTRRGGDGRRGNNDNNNKSSNNNNNRGGNNNNNSGKGNNNNSRGNSNNNNSGNRGGNNNNRNNNNNNGGNRGGNNAQPRRAREPQLTREDLDRQLENYHN